MRYAARTHRKPSGDSTARRTADGLSPRPFAAPGHTGPHAASDGREAERFGHSLEQSSVGGRVAGGERRGGQPLPVRLRAKLERAMGHDFSGVRVHRNGKPAAAGVDALTEGERIHFAPGRYDPASAEGGELIAHELAHVVQQRAGRVAAPQGKSLPVNTDPALEAEAESVGAQVAAQSDRGTAGRIQFPAASSASRTHSAATQRTRGAGGTPAPLQGGKYVHKKKTYNTRARKRKAEMFRSDVLKVNVLPEGTIRKRKGVARYGVGSGNVIGLGAFSSSYSGVPTTDVRRAFSKSDRARVNKLGKTYGCHQCGTQTEARYIPDHQPPLSDWRAQHGNLHSYKGQLFPHCKKCSSKQGGALSKKYRG